MNHENEMTEVWLGVIARSLAYLCLNSAGLKQENLGDRVKFLDNLGLKRKDAAQLLGITDKTFTEVLSRARKKKTVKTRRSVE